MIMWKGKNVGEPKAQTARVYPTFFSMKHGLEYYCYSPLDGMLVHHRVNPPGQQQFAGTHTCVKRDKI